MKGSSTSAGPTQNAWLPSVATNLTAAGTTQATATPVPAAADLAIFTTVASGSGAILPAAGISAGESYEVANHGGNALSLYPPVGGQIGTLGVNAAYSIAAGKFAIFRAISPKTFASCP